MSRRAPAAPAARGAAPLRGAPTLGTTGVFTLAITDEFVQAVAEQVAALLRAEQQQAQQQPDRWLDTKQAARYLSVPVSRINRAVLRRESARNPIPLVKDGGRNYYRASELDEWRRNGGLR